MKIPKYVQELMSRAHYYYDFDSYDPRCGAGYTIAIRKETPFTYASTLNAEVERLKKWVDRQPGGECHIISVPTKTTHGTQVAIITVFDPVMQHIEGNIHP